MLGWLLTEDGQWATYRNIIFSNSLGKVSLNWHQDKSSIVEKDKTTRGSSLTKWPLLPPLFRCCGTLSHWASDCCRFLHFYLQLNKFLFCSAFCCLVGLLGWIGKQHRTICIFNPLQQLKEHSIWFKQWAEIEVGIEWKRFLYILKITLHVCVM